ncbi:MAG TPA: AfsR/SARP family transcriptional regulator [Umezawaea sp.]|nr:AfsR/SARP family transcriptional regulator [Umezawaea sp.]
MTEKTTATSNNAVDFRLWGPVEAYQHDQRVDMGTEKERCLLVALLEAKAGVISRSSLWDWLWDTHPVSAAGDLDRYMTNLRKRLDSLRLRAKLVNKDRHCRLDIPNHWVDVHRLQELVRLARKSNDREAADSLRDALLSTRNEPLVGISGRRIDGYRTELIEWRRTVEIAFNEVEIRLGNHRERIPELTRLFDDRPYDSTITTLLMTALYRAGRQSDALNVFQQHRKNLKESGVEMQRPLHVLQERILRNDEALRTETPSLRTAPLSSSDAFADSRRRLVAAFFSDEVDVDTIRASLAEPLLNRARQVATRDNCLIVIPQETDAAQLVGHWMKTMRSSVRHRVRVGVAIGDESAACDLAKSRFAKRVLEAAVTSRVVVTVSDDVYNSFVKDKGPYRRSQDDESAWVRLPDYSVAPEPLEEGAERVATPSTSTGSNPTVIFHGATTIGNQFNAGVINYGRTASDDR